jgi:hypothetical protein
MAVALRTFVTSYEAFRLVFVFSASSDMLSTRR